MCRDAAKATLHRGDAKRAAMVDQIAAVLNEDRAARSKSATAADFRWHDPDLRGHVGSHGQSESPQILVRNVVFQFGDAAAKSGRGAHSRVVLRAAAGA